MKMLKSIPAFFFAFLILFLTGKHSEVFAQTTVTLEMDGKEWSYEIIPIDGWTIYYHEIQAKDQATKEALCAELAKSFRGIKWKIPAKHHEFLQGIKIWVSDEPNYPFRPKERSQVCFHRSRAWLRSHGLNPLMANGIHFINPAIILEQKKFEDQPELVLHELSHAYHRLVLKDDNPVVLRAYKEAMALKLYHDVPSKKDPEVKLDRAYASNNEKEYFAELTEAYFGENDWYPWNRKLLSVYDPTGYQMIEKVWEVDAQSKQTER